MIIRDQVHLNKYGIPTPHKFSQLGVCFLTLFFFSRKTWHYPKYKTDIIFFYTEGLN